MSTKKIYFRFLQGLLTLLGFGSAFSCSTPDEYGPLPEDYKLLYGPPPSEYRDSVEVLYGPLVEEYRDSTDQQSASGIKENKTTDPEDE